jgi:RHS repeat-associated protein
VYLSRNIDRRGAVTSVSSDGQRLMSHPLGIYYTDVRSGNWIRLAEIKSSVGIRIATNKIVYPDAFAGLRADILVAINGAKLEVDTILRERPVKPSSLGLSDEHTLLEVVTEFLGAEPLDAPADLAPPEHSKDNHGRSFSAASLRLGGRLFLPGTAYALRPGAVPALEVPVTKTWTVEDGRSFLREQLPFAAIEAGLQALPEPHGPAHPNPPGPAPARWVASPPAAHGDQGPMVAATLPDYPGFVIDWATVSDACCGGGYVFESERTYLLQHDTVVYDGDCEFQPGTVLKFPTGEVQFSVYRDSRILCTGQPFYLTALDDDTYGETIEGSTGNPSGVYGRTPLGLYEPTGDVTISGAVIKYGHIAIDVLAGDVTPPNTAVQIENVQVQNGTGAVRNDGAFTGRVSVTCNNLTTCNLLWTTSGPVTVNGPNSCPSIAGVANQTIAEDSSVDLTFTIDDSESSASTLTVEADPRSASLLAPSGLSFSGTNSQRTLHVQPAANTYGQSWIVVTVRDPNGGIATTRFLLTVLPDNDSLSLSTVPRFRLRAGEEATFEIPVFGAGLDPGSLSLAVLDFDSAKLESALVESTDQSSLRRLRVVPGSDLGGGTITLRLSEPGGGTETKVVDFNIQPDPNDPDGPPHRYDPPGTGEDEPCEPLQIEHLPDYLQVELPDTCCSTPGGSCTAPLLSPVTDRVEIVGSPGCEYQFEATIEATMRVSDGGTYGPADVVTLGADDDQSTGVPRIGNPLDSNPMCGDMQSSSASGIIHVSFLDCGRHWIVLRYAPGSNQTANEGFRDAWAKVTKVWGLRARRAESSLNDGNWTSIGSVDVGRTVGKDAFGFGSPRLQLRADLPSPAVCNPNSLCVGPVALGSDPVSLTPWEGLRQFLSPSALVDICTNSCTDYCIRFYGLSLTSAPPSKLPSGLYPTNGLALWKAVKVLRPNPTDTNCHQIVDARFDGQGGLLSTLTNQYDYLPPVGGTSVWALVRGARQRVERLEHVSAAGARTDTHTILETNKTTQTLDTVLETRERYDTLPFGTALAQRILAPGGPARTSTYWYYTNLSDPGYGRLRQSTNSDGSWQILHYDTSGRVMTVFSSVGNQAPTTNAALCRKIDYDYSPIVDAADTGAFRPQLPRREVEYLLGLEIARRYFVYRQGEKREIRCVLPNAAWNATGNLVTVTRHRTREPFKGQMDVAITPDGTCTRYEYITNATMLTNIVWHGAPDASGTNVGDGTKTVTVSGLAGQVYSRHVFDVPTGHLIAHDQYSDFDPETHQPRRVTHLDGTVESSQGSCCGSGSAESAVDREGVLTEFDYDELGRLTNTVRLGISTANRVDALGRVTEVLRKGTGESGYTTVKRSAYDSVGRLASETDAAGVLTTYTYGYDALGQSVKTTTLAAGTPSESHRIDTFAKDGTLVRVDGTAVSPVKYEYGFETIDGINARYRLEIKLDASGGTNEWTKTYTDMAGREFKTVYAAASQPYPFSLSTYDSAGRLASRRDPDGIVTLYSYDARGELENTALDLNGNGLIDLDHDRVTRTVTVVTNTANGTVRLARTYVWDTQGSAVSNLVSTVETSIDGLQTWSTVNGLTITSATAIDPGTTTRTVTQTAPDNTSTVTVYLNGRLDSVTRKDNTGAQIGRTTYAYDAHGRQYRVTDAGNGATTYAYDAADRVISVTSPPPGTGHAPQTTLTDYDELGRARKLTLSDGTAVTNVYYSTGLLQRTSGSRTYPVEYTYDAQGRVQTMKTWQNFAGSSGAATTTWNYDAYRGWLASKQYQGGSGPFYTYTPGGRLKTRSWVRTGSAGAIATTYAYGFDDGLGGNQHADVVTVAYNDNATPAVTTDYDRLGRVHSLTAGTNALQRSWNSAGLSLGDAWTNGILAGLSVNTTYDSSLRRQTLAARTGGTGIGPTFTNTYDGAGRLASVTDGSYTAAYGYVSDSPLWNTLEFKQNTTLRATTSRQFDYLNRLLSISTAPTGTGSGALASAYAYNQANQRLRRTEADDTYWVYEYDNLGQVVSGKRYWAGGVPVAGQQYEYTYDDIGNRKSARQGGNDIGTGLRSASYTANLLNQYSGRTNAPAVDVLGLGTAAATVTVNGGATTRQGAYFWRELAVTNASAPAWTPSTVTATAGTNSTTVTGRLLTPPGTQTLAYDADGNLTNDLVWSYSWDAENRLLAMETLSTVTNPARARVTWDYDPAGRRIRSTVATNWTGSAYSATNETKYLYDGWACIAELTAANALVRQYAWGLDLSGTPTGAGGVGGLLWMRPAGGAAHFAAFDGNGNVVALVDGGNGTVSARYDYEPFGATIRMTGTVAKDNAFRFSTKRAEDTTGIILYEFRPYSPVLGRWANRDPIGEKGGMNPYAFCLNDPHQRFDRLGLSPISIGQFLWPCVKDLIKQGFLTGLTKYLDELGACGLMASSARIEPEFDLCRKPQKIVRDFAPAYDGKKLRDALVGCLWQKLKSKALDDLEDEAEKQLMEKILEVGTDAASSALQSDVRMEVQASCQSGEPVLQVNYVTEFRIGERVMAYRELASGKPFTCPKTGPAHIQHICCCKKP